MFLDDVTPFKNKDWPEKEREYSSWVKVAEYIYKDASADDVVRLLQLELLTKRRDYNITRLYSRFSKLRMLEETKDLPAFFAKFTDTAVNPGLANLPWAIVDSRANTVDEIIMIAKSEIMYSFRHYVVRRLYGKYGTLRRKLEQKEIPNWSLRKLPNDIW